MVKVVGCVSSVSAVRCVSRIASVAELTSAKGSEQRNFMTEPTVACIMLTRDRHELAAKAVKCFESQRYGNKRLVIFDNGTACIVRHHGHFQHCEVGGSQKTIGVLRNEANAFAKSDEEILIHWDDDDFSHPNRIGEQVALLQASGADAVGYNEMLFWRWQRSVADTMSERAYRETVGPLKGQAWLYSNTKPPGYALGTSLCYWRKTWEQHHFANETQGVEDHWLREKNVVSVSSLCAPGKDPTFQEPRMIARIHSGNTSNGYRLEEYVAAGSKEWKRVPEWDARVRELLEAVTRRAA